MPATIYLHNIKRYLNDYTNLVSDLNQVGLMDEANNAETLFGSIYKILYGWNLVNANLKKRSQDGFDLEDKRKGIFVQVTSNKNYQEKIRTTIAGIERKRKTLKIKKVLILFISRDCPKSILTTVKSTSFSYEVQDMKSLFAEIRYKMVRSGDLKEINHQLKEAISPMVILEQTTPTTAAAKILIPRQLVKPRGKGAYINRPALTEALFQFSRKGNALLTGKPGIGKSTMLEDLQRHCNSKKIPCFIIRVNELLDGTDEELQTQLKINTHWLTVFKKIGPNKAGEKGLLIFDAFDTAKEERLKKFVLQKIGTAIKELKEKWLIIASVRTFDAHKSINLMELFPIADPRKEVFCRHFEIPELTNLELAAILKKHKSLHDAVALVRPEVKELIKIPYFFKLLEKIVQIGNKYDKKISRVRTEEELLELYWKQVITQFGERDLLAQKLTKILLLHENLCCTKSEVITEQAVPVLDDLVSNDIITASSVGKQTLAFSHNILLEFAVSRYVIPPSPQAQIEWIKNYPVLPFHFRQSFVYFFTHLWYRDRMTFWKFYFEIRLVDNPIFRLLHLTTLNYVLGSCYKDVNELSPVFEIADDKERAICLAKILHAVRFITQDHPRKLDASLLLAISRRMHPYLVWEVGFLLEKSLDDAPILRHTTMIGGLAKASSNYFRFVMDARKIAATKFSAENNGGRFALLNVVKTFEQNNVQGKKHLLEILGLLDEQEPFIPLIYHLADQIPTIAVLNPELAVMVFQKIYSFHEQSNKTTYLGGNSVIRLSSNRVQDVQMIQHNLEGKFEPLLQIIPAQIMVLGMQLSNQSRILSGRTWGVSIYPFKILEKSCRLIPDIIITGLDYEKENGPLSFAHKIFDFLSKKMEENKIKEVKATLGLLLTIIESAALWNMLLRFLLKHRNSLKNLSFQLLQSLPLLFTHDTRYDIGNLLAATWPGLTKSEKLLLEKKIWSISTTRYLKKDEASKDHIIANLLHIIPRNDLQMGTSHELLDKIKVEIVVRPSSGPQPYKPTWEEKIHDTGLEHAPETEIDIFKAVENLGKFTSAYNNKKETPSTSASLPFFPVAKDIFTYRKQKGFSSKKLLSSADYEITHFIQLLLRSNVRLTNSIMAFTREVVTYYLESPDYRVNTYEEGNHTNDFGAYGLHGRTSAVSILIRLLHTDKKKDWSKDLVPLFSDNSKDIRLIALRSLNYFWHRQPEIFWEIITDRATKEKEGSSIAFILKNLCYDDILRSNLEAAENVVKSFIYVFFDRTKKIHTDLWSQYCALLLKMYYHHNSEVARILLTESFDLYELMEQVVFHTIPLLADTGDQEGLQRYNHLLNSLVNFSFEQIIAKGPDHAEAASHFSLIDKVVQQLYFATEVSTARRTRKKTGNALPPLSLQQAKPVIKRVLDHSLNINGGFMLTHTGYYLMKTLNHFLSTDPAYVLQQCSLVIQCTKANGVIYDHTVFTEIMTLVDTILADHKVILNTQINFDQLVYILDSFSDAGWPKTLEFTWKLKEAF